MANPNEPVPPQRPQQPAAPAQRPAQPAQQPQAPRPAAPAQPVQGQPVARPPAPAQQPAQPAARPAASPQPVQGQPVARPSAPQQPAQQAPRPAAPAQAPAQRPASPAAQPPAQPTPRPAAPAQPVQGQPVARPSSPPQQAPSAARPAAPAQPAQPTAARPPAPGQPTAARPPAPPAQAPRPPAPGSAPAGQQPPRPAVPPQAAPPQASARPPAPGAAIPVHRPAVTPPPTTARPAAPGAPSAPPRPQAAVPPAAQQAPRPASPPARPPAAAGQPPRPAPTPGVRPAAPPPAAARPPAKPGAPAPLPAAPAAGKPPAKAPPPGVRRPASKSMHGLAGRNKIGQKFVDLGFIEEDQLVPLLDEAVQTGQGVDRVAVSRGIINEDQVVQALAELHGLKVVNLAEVKPAKEAVEVVPETMATLYKILPLAYNAKESTLSVAMSDPTNLHALDDIRNLLGIKNVQAGLAPARAIEEAIVRTYQGKDENIVDIIKQLETDTDLNPSHSEKSIDIEELIELSESAPVRKLINMVFLMAIRDHASDIHFEPFEEEYKMRYRCDGVLTEMVPPPRHLAMAIASRIKVMANLDIAERRLPQDGRIELTVGGTPLDMRVSVLPTMFGESVVIRVLDRTVVNLDLEKVGMNPTTLAQFRTLIHKPNGIVLVTGPTGSGKTTTLYSALSELNGITDKIITTEDPVEYEIDGICQCPINADIDLTFANALRAILRQDPDIILVGEIRDLETAQIAVQASLTGHLVFSTLHTNDAASTITRLRDMGIEPYLITATVEGILAQRLVRKICVECRMPFEPGAEQLMELGIRPQDVKGKKFFYGAGCPKCNNTGYKGRSGLFELIAMNDELRDLISQGGSTDKVQAAIRKQGVIGLREQGLNAMFAGITTIDEVVRETVMEEDI